MSELSSLSSTLYVPLQGRVYGDIMYPDILADSSAKYAWTKISNVIKRELALNQTEYTLLASAIRSKNFDFIISKFLKKHEDGIVINIGCGFEDLYSRNDNGKAIFVNLDLPEVLKVRSKCFNKNEREYELDYSMFDYRWIDAVKEISTKPSIIIASGLFYYFSKDEIINFIEHLQAFDDTRIVFDSVSSQGIKISKKYMKDLKKEDAEMKFYLDDLGDLINSLDFIPRAYKKARYYSYIRKFKVFTPKILSRFVISDKLNMVMMNYIRV